RRRGGVSRLVRGRPREARPDLRPVGVVAGRGPGMSARTRIAQLEAENAQLRAVLTEISRTVVAASRGDLEQRVPPVPAVPGVDVSALRTGLNRFIDVT